MKAWNFRSCPIHYEPGGYDFLSPCLQEADLMNRVLVNEEDFSSWLENFLPDLFNPEFVLKPGEVQFKKNRLWNYKTAYQVNDRTDGKLVHLDGVNFSRAWSLYGLAKRLSGEISIKLFEIADEHVKWAYFILGIKLTFPFQGLALRMLWEVITLVPIGSLLSCFMHLKNVQRLLFR